MLSVSHQGFRQPCESRPQGEANPKLPVCALAEPWIESSNLGKERPFRHDARRRADDVALEEKRSEGGTLRSTAAHFHDTSLLVGDFESRCRGAGAFRGPKAPELPLELLRLPSVVGVQERHITSRRLADSAIASGCHPVVLLSDRSD